MSGVYSKAVTLICLVLATFAIIENVFVFVIYEHLYSGVETKTTIGIFTIWQWAGGDTNVTGEESDSHHRNLIPGIRFDDHKLFAPFPSQSQDAISDSFTDLHTNKNYSILDILNRWSNLTLPFLDKNTPILHLPPFPPRLPAPKYCGKDNRVKNWLIECQNFKSRDLSPWEQSGNHIMFTLRTTTSFHSSRLPLLFQTWMTAVNRSNIFIVTDGRDKLLEHRAKEAGENAYTLSALSMHAYCLCVGVLQWQI